MLVIAVGLGLLFMPVTLVAMSRVADSESGIAASLRNTGQQVGGSIGLAVLGTVAWTVVASSAHAQTARAAATAAPAGQPAHPGQAGLTAIYHHALATGFSRAFLVTAPSCCSPWSSRSRRSGRSAPTSRKPGPEPPGHRTIHTRHSQVTPEETMKLTIIAATGGVGAELLEQAVAAGHDVTAVVRNPAKLSRQVRTVTADMTAPDPAALESAMAGADAVLSGLGPHSNSDAGIASQGTRAIVAAMRAAGVRRIVAVSAAPVSTVPSPGNPSPPRHDPGDGFFMRHLFSHVASAMFGKVYADLAQMEDILAKSGLDWTVVRPPQLKSKPPTGNYRTAYGQNIRGGWSVPRADVAHLMLHVLGQPETIRQAIGIAS
jgi:putative NADH-flavin reductase